MKIHKFSRFSPIVSRETLKRIFNVTLILYIIFVFSGCGEDVISDDIAGINKVLSTKYDISSPEELARFYHDFLYDSEQGKFTYELTPQTHSRIKVVMINHNPVHQNMAAEKFELLVKKNETTWKIVVVNRNWKCNGSDKWGVEPCN